MVDKPISLTPGPTVTEKPIELNSSPVVSPETADNRTRKINFALGEKSPGPDVIYSSILAGRENQLREQAAFDESLKLEKARQEWIFAASAAKKGQPLTEEEMGFFTGLSHKVLANPDTVLEKMYAKQVVNNIVSNPLLPGNSTYDALIGDPTTKLPTFYGELNTAWGTIEDLAFAEQPEVTHAVRDRAEDTIAKNEIAQRELEGIDYQWNQTGVGGRVWDFLEGMIPFVNSIQQGNVVDVPWKPSWFLGDNKKEMYSYLSRLPVDEFQKHFSAAVKELRGRNLFAAQSFVDGWFKYTRTAAFLDSSMDVADIIGVVSPVGKAALRIGKVADYAATLKNTIKGLDPRRPEVSDVLAAGGKIEASAKFDFLNTVRDGFYNKDPMRLAKDLLANIPTWMNPNKWEGGGTGFSRAIRQELLDRDAENAAKLTKSLTDRTVIDRLSPEGMEAAYTAARAAVTTFAEKAHVNDSIIDIVEHGGTGINAPHVELRLGRPDKTFFENRHQAENFLSNVYGLKKTQARVEVGGADGYYIAVRQVLDETLPEVKDALISTTNVTPKSNLITLLGEANKYRTSNELISKEQTGIRSTAIQGASEISRLSTDVARDIQALSRGSKTRFRRFAEAMRDYTEIVQGETVRGRFFNTLGEFEHEWKDLFGLNPTKQEAQAYLAYVRLNQYDYILRNFQIYNFKARQGVKQWQFQKGKSFFEGKEIDQLPWGGKQPFNLMYVGEDGTSKMYISKFMSKELKDQVNESITNAGYKVVHLFSPFENGFDKNAPVNFVVVKTAESKPLNHMQIPYKPGGHVVYDYNHFGKIPEISTLSDGTHIYNGEKVLFPATTEVETRKWVGAYNEARKLWLDKKMDVFKDFVSKNLPFTPESLSRRFASKELNPEMPAVYAHRGESSFHSPEVQSTWGREGKLFSWHESDYNLAKGMDTEFAGTRNWDVNTFLEKEGSENRPMFQFDRPRLLDPLSTVSKAVGRLSRNVYMQDYQIRTAEHFVEEFHSVLKKGVERRDEFRKNPIAMLFDPPWDEGTSNKELLVAAKNFQRSALNLIGVRSDFQKGWSSVQEKLLNSVYEKFGQETSDWMYEKFLPKIKDPTRFARQVAFHSKLGLFNPIQLFVQAQTFTHMLGLAGPIQAGKGFGTAAIWRRMLLGGANMDDPKWVNHFAGMASKFGWKQEDFVEAFKFMRASGINNIGTQHSWKTDFLDPGIFQGKIGRWADKSAVFFNETERMIHLIAHATAYSEWRKLNPVAKLDNAAVSAIMDRYDMLTVNMTHASDSALNKGFLSVAGQFFSYQERLAEQFLGKRLSKTEKARLLATYSAVYGVPITLSASTAVPFYEEFRQRLLEKGVQDNIFVEGLSEGLVSTMLHWATGEQTDLASRYGPNGIPLIRDVWKGKADVMEIFLGASGSILGDIFKSTQPLVMDFAGMFSDAKPTYNLVARDFIDLFSNVSTVSSGAKILAAVNLGRLVNKGEVAVDEINTYQAVIMGITGLSPIQVKDIYVMQDALKHKQELQKFARDQIIKYYRRGFQAKDHDDELAYYRTAQKWIVAGGFRHDEAAAIMAEASGGGLETLHDKTDRQFNKQFPEQAQ